MFIANTLRNPISSNLKGSHTFFASQNFSKEWGSGSLGLASGRPSSAKYSSSAKDSQCPLFSSKGE